MDIILHTKNFIQSQRVLREISSNPVLSLYASKVHFLIDFIFGKVGSKEAFDSKVKHIFWVSGWMGDIHFLT